MTRTYFADSWFFIALTNRTDSHHQAARRLSRTLRPHSLVTHDAVFMEVLAYFSGYGRELRTLAADTVRRAVQEFNDVVPAGRELFIAGLGLYERRPDKAYSLIDCMSMELMKRRGITRVLTNDHHFSQEGFTVLSDAP